MVPYTSDICTNWSECYAVERFLRILDARLWMAATMDLTSYRMNTADEVEGFYSGGR